MDEEPPAQTPLVGAVRHAWEHLAGSSMQFSETSPPRVVVAPTSHLCPPGWCGLVTIAGATIATAPDTAHADVLQRGLQDVLAGASTGPTPQSSSMLARRLPVSDVLGPTDLAYLLTFPTSGTSPSTFPNSAPSAAPSTAAQGVDVHVLEVADPLVRKLVATCSVDDAAEAAIDTLTSPAFVVLRDGAALAVAGYEHWPSSIAHLCVLTHPGARGAGLARAAAAAAGDHALRAGLLPQWRARPIASQRIARTLGYRSLGHQLSLRLAL
ncbi:GNAT family N-acetyltransferase [Kineococcus sp. SYSU DK005]|uniref:GNAT family N-acetyltransferase n=1 Tax=Kineococcus sp. SYSU DK005 TaxID=3383126 RepID=UPI003D7CE44B